MKLNKKIIILAILLAAVTTYGIYFYIKSTQETVTEVKYKQVLVAKNNIPAKTKVDKSMIKIEKIAEEYVLKNAITDEKEIIGKFSIERIIEGEQILPNRLVDLEKIYASYQVPIGKRGITIKVDDVAGVAHLIKPGDYVDVVVFVPEREIEEKSTKTVFPDVTKLTLQNLLVLAIDQEQGFVEKKEEKEKTEEKQEQKVKKITLAVNPADTEKLVLGDEIGKIRLALRHPDEKKVYETSGAIVNDIVPEKGKIILQK